MTVHIKGPVTHIEFRVEPEGDGTHVVGRCAPVADVVASTVLGIGVKTSPSPNTAEVCKDKIEGKNENLSCLKFNMTQLESLKSVNNGATS